MASQTILHNKTTITADPGKLDIVITREFDAPREAVFEAYTDPNKIMRWHGCESMTMTIGKFEPWTGGSWEYSHMEPNGKLHPFHGVYHEVLYPERIINTFEYDALPESGHVILESNTFEELPGNRTLMISRAVHLTNEDRDGHLCSGMEEGVIECYNRLDALLAEMTEEEEE